MASDSEFRNPNFAFSLPRRRLRAVFAALALVAVGGIMLSGSTAPADPVKPLSVADAAKLPPPAETKIDFARDVHPVLEKRCFQCHLGSGASSGHRLDLRADLLGETNGKPLVTPGKSADSKLIHMVAGVAGKAMPLKGPRLKPEEIGVLRAWIDQGVAWDDKLLPPLAEAKHWSFRPVARPDVPAVKNAAWVRNPIDAFIAADHAAAGLAPNPEAPPAILARRLALDLTGLPLTAAELDAFVADQSADAYERLVERLLASPAYGQRWGRHWLDIARYADTEGYESDHGRDFMWRYRDYVIAAFNSDKPYDRFLLEQLAGDELSPYTDENLIATGYVAAARLSSNEEDRPRQVNDVLVDVVNAVGAGLLGLTMNCAQCHNHKFDPITARDYYGLQGFFVRGMSNNLVLKNPELWKAYEAARPAEYEPAKLLQRALFEGGRKRLIEEARKKLTPEQLRAVDTPAEKRTPETEKVAREAELKFQFTPGGIEKNGIAKDDQALYAELTKKIVAIEKKLPPKPQAFGFYSPVGSPHPVEVLPMKGFYPPPFRPAELERAKPHLLIRGEVHQRGAEVPVTWPAVFGGAPDKDAIAKRPRTALAGWLSSRENPLTARVWANRLWHWHFGRGIVATPGDFGLRGAPPTNQPLLDWLAAELMEKGWSTKHLHRLLVTSATYRQSSAVDPAKAELDPDNLKWWRWMPRRLEVEAIRDSMLAVSGELDRSVGGAGTPAEDAKNVRRSVYVHQKRERPPSMQALFDGPTGATEVCSKRNCSTVPLQALFLLNNEFSAARGRALAARVQATAGEDVGRQIEAVFRTALGRRPDEFERAAAERFFVTRHETPAEPKPAESKDPTSKDEPVKVAPKPASPPSALVLFCQAILSVNEFVYLE